MINPFAPPIDLSHLPNYRQTDARPRRAVFLGRVSTKDRQLPASSIPRQVVLAAERLDPGEEFIAHFWDVESGMLPAHLRGLGPQEMYDGLGVPTPRDGGLQVGADQDDVDAGERLELTRAARGDLDVQAARRGGGAELHGDEGARGARAADNDDLHRPLAFR